VTNIVQIQNKKFENLHSLDINSLIDKLNNDLLEIEQLKRKGNYQIGLTLRDMLKLYSESGTSGTPELQQEFSKNAILTDIVALIETVMWGLVSLLVRDADFRQIMTFFSKCRILEEIKLLEQLAFQSNIDIRIREYEVEDEVEKDFESLDFTPENLLKVLRDNGEIALECQFGDELKTYINAIIMESERSLEDSDIKVDQYYLQQFDLEDFLNQGVFRACFQVKLSPTLMKMLNEISF